ncbi:amino acid adenylation domain-containing protein [Micromonospora maritima]|uniref:Amino acid adenylation domain-containing protein n=1 Tax=Micromonospora maritima TaxID=986711 RepID=A0ABW7ZF75_9ACTN
MVMLNDAATDARSPVRVLRNDDGQVALWPAAAPAPAGWVDTGVAGAEDDCLRQLAAPLPEPAPVGGATLVDLFRDSVRRHPDRPALVDAGQTLTYAEADAESDRLARQLIGRGVRPGDRVAVHRPRDVDLWLAVLAVLKAGAAYVAVDSRYPDARRDLMIEAARVRLTVTLPGWGDRCPGEVWAWRRGAEAPESDAELPAVPANAVASVLFSSGSTGVPKAIVLEHRNLVSFARNPSLPELTPTDRVGQISSVSFDAFHFETWCTLAAGSAVVILPPLRDLVGADLRRELRRRGITAMCVPTMAFNKIVSVDQDAFASLRILHTGGDVLLPAACRELLAGEFGGRLYNLYGPAEISTACTAHEVREVAPDAPSVPIGVPLHGATVHLLDADLKPVPQGAVGEIHVGGPGVARGYLDRADLTAQRFRPDPFGEVPGARLYATGDLARQRPDGLFDFVGRADGQVKIRGYRVEPREVERALLGHPEVREAAVEVEGGVGDRHLVALIVGYDTVRVRELRAYAEEVLPDFMVPASFLVVPEIPATDHGKRDQAGVRQLLEEWRRRRADHREPNTEVERYLADLWADLLANERIGSTDDFFALGGHSMLAFQAQRRIRRDLGVALEFHELLDHTVLGDLAARIERSRPSAQ